jgi:hypothetical protein
LKPLEYILPFATAIPFIHYFLAIYSSSKFFLQGCRDPEPQPDPRWLPGPDT